MMSCPPGCTGAGGPAMWWAVVAVGTPAATVICGIASVTGTRSDGLALTESYPLGATRITWTATAGPGNQASCTQAITVTDQQAPVIAGCPANLIQGSDAGKCWALVTWPAPT